MTENDSGTGSRTGPAKRSSTPTASDLVVTVAQATDPFLSDTYAWCGIHLDDGRLVSIAWLRDYAGAVASRWRRYR